MWTHILPFLWMQTNDTVGCADNIETVPLEKELQVRVAAAAAPERYEGHAACRLREAARAVIFEQVHGRNP